MGQSPLPYSVTVLADGRHRTIGEYAAYKVARRVARAAMDQPKATLATVKTVDGKMVYAIDPNKEWEGEPH